MDFQSLLNSIRETTLRAQQSYSEDNWKADRIKKALMLYLIMDRRFDPQFRDQRLLLERGSVVWGSIVQANSALFEPRGGSESLPAAILYSLDPRFDAAPQQLTDYAHNMFDLKGQSVSPEMQDFADKLANEMVADIKLPVPVGFTGGLQCYYATLLIVRKHLPLRHLAQGIFPLLVAPQETDAVMILPQAYWGDFFRGLWTQA